MEKTTPKAILEPGTGTSEESCLFTWKGKTLAGQEADIPSTSTLTPVKEDSKDWERTQNMFIEGDNLEALRLLQKSHAGRIRLIYIDPPYNTGKDFIYKDNYKHSSWLNMMYPRLLLARNLLKDDGLIFISIDDNEMPNLRKLCDEVFGEANFISSIIVRSNKRGQTYKDIAKTHEYLLAYSRSDNFTIAEIEKEDDALPYEDRHGKFDLWELRNRNPRFGRHNRPNLYFPIYISADNKDANGYHKISLTKGEGYDIETFPTNSEGKESCWRWSREKITTEDLESDTPVLVARQTRSESWNVYERSRKNTTKVKSIWDETSMISEQGTAELAALGLKAVFDHPKPLALVERIIQITTGEDDIILDFFAGSGTTAQAVMQLNAKQDSKRRFIVIQLPEPLPPGTPAHQAGLATISAITKERIRRAGEKLCNPSVDTGFRVFRLG